MPGAPSVGEVLAGKYRVERILGQGGMGVVVQAMHLQLDERVAVKFLLPEYADHPEASARFLREARAAVKIKSEHVARVIDVGTLESGAPYMVMEFLHGHDLAQELDAKGSLPRERAVDYILQAGEAIAEAHAAGIVHRDLKPANLFLTQRADGSKIVKVLDFGISKVTSPTASGPDLSLTKTSSLMGSPLYMSPEQMRSSRDVDTRTDIWSLGAILYETLTGRTPFVGESLPQVCTQILQDDPPALRDFKPELPAELERAVLKALEKDREKRYPSVAEFAFALVPFGSKNARTSVERISRVLGAAGLSRSHESLAFGATEVRPASGTVGAWGQSGEVTRPAPPRRNQIVAGSIALAVVGGIGAAYFLLQPSGAAPVPSMAPDTNAAALAVPSSRVPPATANAPAATVTPALSAPPEATASAVPSAAQSAATPAAPQPTAPPPARRAAKKPKQTTTEKATTNDVSLFGDRK